MKKNVKILCLFCLLSFILCTFSYAKEEGFIRRMLNRFSPKAKIETKVEEEEKKAEEKKVKQGPVKEVIPTDEEMVNRIKDALDEYGKDLISRVARLVRGVDEEGNLIYLFRKSSGKEVDFEDLDEEVLYNLYRNVTTQARIIRQEKLDRQTDQLRQFRRIEEQRRTIRRPQAPQIPRPPTLPTVHTGPPSSPPAPPSVPVPPSQSVSQPPQLPPRPPTVPETR